MRTPRRGAPRRRLSAGPAGHTRMNSKMEKPPREENLHAEDIFWIALERPFKTQQQMQPTSASCSGSTTDEVLGLSLQNSSIFLMITPNSERLLAFWACSYTNHA